MRYQHGGAARLDVPCACCSLCRRELLRGEEGWYLNGKNVCGDCFETFARAELAPYEITFGMEERR